MAQPTDGMHGGRSYRLRGASGTTFASASTALLVIDPVNDFLSEGGAAWDLTKSTVTSHDVVGHLKIAIEGARERGIPVLFAPMAYTAEDYEDHELARRSGINRIMFERKMFLAGSWGADFHPELRPADEEVVLQPHKGTDVFETDLPDHLVELGTTHLVIAGMTANLCCESTGRHAAEHGYDVTYLRDAIGAENMPAYEASIRLNYPLIGNAVLDVEDFLAAIDSAKHAPEVGDTVLASDHLEIGAVEELVLGDEETPGYLLVPRGKVFHRDTYIPLDAVVKVAENSVFVNMPRVVVGKMPWDEPPSRETRRDKVGPARAQVDKLYASRGPSLEQSPL
jgi:ureidoacrylate peracid hydrolase